MTKDELKTEAEKLGLKVKTGFMDDLVENLIVLVFGILLGRFGFPWLF